MHAACSVGHADFIKDLILFNNSIEVENNNGETPLFHVKDYRIISQLLSDHPSLTHLNKNNLMPVIQHIMNDNIDTVHELLKCMKLNLPDNILVATNQLPFYHAKSLEMVRILMKYSACRQTLLATPHFIKINRATPQQNLLWSTMNAQPNINICDKHNETLLHYAAQENRYDVAAMLMKKKIDLFTQSITGQTALHIATYHNYPEFIALLLSYAIELEGTGIAHAKSILLEKKDMDGSTALMIAVIENKTSIAHDLINNGADINTRNKYGHTLLHFVQDIVLAQKLIDFGLEVDSTGMYGHTPLHFAKNSQIAQLLIINGANVNAETIDSQTPLHLAKTPAVAQALISNRALVNKQNKQGRTPLHCAVVRNNAALCKILLDNHANKHINDFACVRSKKKAENAVDAMSCYASYGFFIMEDLDVLLRNRARVPFWFECRIASTISNNAYIEESIKKQRELLKLSQQI